MIEVLTQPLDRTDEHIEAEWRRLENETSSSFFVSWDWVGTLLATLPANCGLLLLRLSEHGNTVGLAYFGQENALRHWLVWSNRLHFNSPGEPEFNCMTIEDNLLITRPGLQGACWDAVLNWFARDQNSVDELVLPGLRGPLNLTSNCRDLWRDDIEVRSWHIDLKRLETTGGKIADLLSTNARYQLRKSMRDYGGGAVLSLIEARSSKEALAWFDNMKAMHIDSWERRGKLHAFSRPFFETFHRNLIQRTFSTGRIQMLRVQAGSNPIGYLYNFRDGPRVYAYQSGFADRDRRLRPGVVSHALAIEHNFRARVRVYDFMAGTNRLKSSFATDWRNMYWTTIQLPRTRFRLENLMRRAKRCLFSR